MATFDLGRVTPLYKGDYNASASYELNDVVLYNGNLYWHIQATATVGIAPTDTTVWKLAFADEGVRAEIRGYADDAQASADSALSSKTAAAQSASQASASASQAALSAQTASTKASEASTSAQTASTKASEASTSAQSAASSAQTATDKATLASQKAAAASESASLATAKASAAATSETNAAASAQTATAKASEAAASATSAQEYDESAQASAVNAQTAQGLAETAQTAAETAQGLAEDARDDAQEIVDGINAKSEQIDQNTASIVTLEEDCYKPYATDTASGAVVSFMDGADDIPLKSLVVNIDPIQDLHGQDAPYPAGGGKNLFDAVTWGTLGNNQSYYTVSEDETITVTADDTSSITSRTFSLEAGETYSFFTTGGFTAVRIFNSSSSSLGNAISGTFTCPEDGKVALKPIVASVPASGRVIIVKGSTAPTAWSPYENICLISGWTGANVVASGKNLFDIQSLLLETGTYASGVLTDTVINLYKAFGQNDKTMPFVPPKGQLVISFNAYTDGKQSTNGRGFSVNAKYTDGTASIIVSVTNATTTKTYRSGATNASKTVESLYINFGEGSNNIWHISDLQLELGSTATPYEPYNGQTIPISWQTEAGTVYGGKLDVLSGVLTVDRAMVDLGTLNWNYINGASEVKYFRSEAVTNAKRPSANAEATGAIFSTYATISAYDVYLGNTGGGIDSISNVRIYDPNYTDAAVFKTAMSGVQFCYELATPITVQLTPHEVKSLLGQNNIWADTGDTSTEYRADTKLYIERLIEPDADMIADSNIVSGQYFMVGNSLYLATANIASGSAVIVGTNCTQKSLSEALNEINQ